MSHNVKNKMEWNLGAMSIIRFILANAQNENADISINKMLNLAHELETYFGLILEKTAENKNDK